MTISVTIGVCLRNCENDVRHIVNRICNQDFPPANMEVIFVDDGSEDNTFSAISEHGSKMNLNYKIYRHNWKGLGYSRNIVLKNARGNYVVWIDDGTLLPKEYVRKLVTFIEKHLDIGIARGVIGFLSSSNIVATLENMSHLAFNDKHEGKYTTKLIGTGGSIYRVKAAKQVGGFNENIQGAAEDNDIAFRLLSIGWRIFILRVKFFIKEKKEMRKVWKTSLWYGYGSHFTFHRHKKLRRTLYRSTPIAGFFQGILASIPVYKLTHKKISFLLPIFFSIKRVGWCLGFVHAHLDSYGHLNGVAPLKM